MRLNDSYFFFIGLSFGSFFLLCLRYYRGKNKLGFILKFLFLSLFGIFTSKNIYLLNRSEFNGIFGGYVFFGFLIPFFLIWIFNKNQRMIEFFRVIAINLPIAHSIGRVGCYFNNCCGGRIFKFPVAIIEALFLFFLHVYLLKKANRENLFQIYLINYCIFRFVIEFFRNDPIRGMFFGFSTSQLISIGMLILIFVQLIFFEQKIQERKVQI